MKATLHLFCLAFFLSLSTVWAAEVTEAQKTYKDIEQTLGSVPQFLKDYPEDAISGAWLDMKNLQLNPRTALIGKDKELIGLAVAAQIPCRYCTYFHTQSAKLNKASSQEMKEAIAVAATTRRWSTYLYGTQSDLANFKAETDKMFEIMTKNKSRQAEQAPVKVPEPRTAAEAYKDMEATIGFVPEFMKNYPKDSVAGVWRELKAIDMNPDTALSAKTKNLIGLAVAAQIPCEYCTYYSTKSAMFNGATPQEINEAVAMAGTVRTWSTVLNGHYTDEKKFEAETNRIMKFVKSKMPKEVSLR